jgi:GTP pyrophosphokinase
MNEQNDGLLLTARFTKAIEYARQLHTEFRKGTHIPYMAHLLGVASLVMGEAGGRIPVTEDMVVAAILHDVVEDQGGALQLEAVRNEFGSNVARMVEGLSDTLAEDHNKKEGWKERKRKYLDHLRSAPEDELLISAADKLYNAEAILDDFKEIGPAIWKRFKRGPDEQLWYFRELLAIFQARLGGRIVNELAVVVGELARLTGA